MQDIRGNFYVHNDEDIQKKHTITYAWVMNYLRPESFSVFVIKWWSEKEHVAVWVCLPVMQLSSSGI